MTAPVRHFVSGWSACGPARTCPPGARGRAKALLGRCLGASNTGPAPSPRHRPSLIGVFDRARLTGVFDRRARPPARWAQSVGPPERGGGHLLAQVLRPLASPSCTLLLQHVHSKSHSTFCPCSPTRARVRPRARRGREMRLGAALESVPQPLLTYVDAMEVMVLYFRLLSRRGWGQPWSRCPSWPTAPRARTGRSGWWRW